MSRPRPTDRHGPRRGPSAASTASQVFACRGPTIRIYDRVGWSVVQVDGEFDLQSTWLRHVLDGTGPWIVFDLKRVEFMDARGLSLLAAGLRHAYRNGGAVRIAGAPRQVRKLLTMTRMNQRIPVFSSLRKALASPK